MILNRKLKANQKAWNKAAPDFFKDCTLPFWGPFNIKDEKILGKIKGGTFLEIGFGSGHSINYLMRKGAKKVYGIDISNTQYDFASKLNNKYINEGLVELKLLPMEKTLPLNNAIDTVFSVYAFGWTINPKKTLKNVFSYLKPGGKFIWSWDHAFFSDVEEEDGLLKVIHSYHEEKEFQKKWRGGPPIYLTYRKTSTWFKLLKEAGFDVVDYLEPAPQTNKSYGKKYYTIQKAQNVPCSMIWVCQKPHKDTSKS